MVEQEKAGHIHCGQTTGKTGKFGSDEHIIREDTTQVRNMKQYLLTVLYSATAAIENHDAAQVNHALYGGERREIRGSFFSCFSQNPWYNGRRKRPRGPASCRTIAIRNCKSPSAMMNEQTANRPPA